MDRNDLVRKHKELLAKARQLGEEARSLEGAEKREKQEESNRTFDALDAVAADIKLIDRADEVSNRFGEPEERRIKIKETSKEVSREIPTIPEIRERSELINRMKLHGRAELSSDEYRLAQRQFPGEEVFWRMLTMPESVSEQERGLYRDWTRAEGEALRMETRAPAANPWATAEGTSDGQAGYLVPQAWEARVHDEAKVVGPMMRPELAHRVDTMTGERLNLTTDLNAKDEVFGIVNENAEVTPGNWALGRVFLDSFKYAKAAAFSYEMVRDTIIDFPGYISRIFGLALGRGVNGDLTKGALGSTTTPVGFETTNNTFKTSQKAAQTISANNLIDLYFGVNSIYRQRGVFQLTDALLKEVRKLADQRGQYLWATDYRSGEPPTILGKRYYENPDLSTPAAAANANIPIVFGDFQAGYAVRHIGRMRMKRNDSIHVLSDQIVLVAFDEWDGDVLLNAALARPIMAD